MKFRGQEEHRNWVLDALAQLGHFIESDPDFHGDRAHQKRSIGYQHRIIEDAKYRVVFLGAFNVGKSTAINAFLGGAYLPMDVEECTSRLTFIQRGAEMSLRVQLSEPVQDEELDALSRVYREIPASIEVADSGKRLTVRYESDRPEGMQRSLEPLITVLADERFPYLATLRGKVDELNLQVLSSVLEDDIVIVDTPGVHSISETRQEITYGVIEHSHLVLDFVDSGFAGNIHDLNFIKRIISCRGRHVFFVLNKADRLETDEIDPRLSRGPAWSLLQAFRRHGIPEDSEVFFFSGYRALKAQQLALGHISLEDVLADNRISLPSGIAERLKDSEDPVRDLSGYLMGQSRLPYLRERLFDYLLNENKAGAVLETAARFIWEHSGIFLAALENEINLAKDPARFDELRANREALNKRLDGIHRDAEGVLARYDARTHGGIVEGKTHPGYGEEFKAFLEEDNIQKSVVAPVLQWLRVDGHLKEARGNKFKTLSIQIEHEVDTFVSAATAALNSTIEANEKETGDAIAMQLGQVQALRRQMTEMGAFDAVILIDASTARGYMAFGVGGGTFGLVAGAIVGSVVPGIGTGIGAGLGGLLGAIGGFLARLAWSDEKWIRRLEPSIRENIMNMLLKGGKDRDGKPAAPIVEIVETHLLQRAATYRTMVQDEVKQAISAVQHECDNLLSREAQIRRERDTILARLQPKLELLRTLREKAEQVIVALAPPNPLA